MGKYRMKVYNADKTEVLERYDLAKGRLKNDTLDGEYILVYIPYDEQTIARIEARKEIASIFSWLKANDWKPNKIITGEWKETDERWTSYLADRLVKRARLDELKAFLNKKQ